MSGVRIVIFAKAPVAGQVKTRLRPRLGLAGSAALAKRMLRHVVAQAVAARIGPVEICAAPGADHPVWSRLGMPDGLQWSGQGSGDLGQRLARVSRRVIGRGEPLLLIGGDCPQLDGGRLRAAAQALDHRDACLVPVSDGGYALLGLRRFHPSLFSDIPWSTSRVAPLTRQRIAAMGWSMQEFAEQHDIDEPADLKWLPEGWLAEGCD